MRGTAAVLVCLISLHYSSVIDADAARFTSENGMPGREHEDKHPRRSSHVKRSLSKTMRQEPDYNWEDYGGIPNIPGYMYRDEYVDKDLDAYDDMDEYVQERLGKSPGAKRSLSASPGKRQNHGVDYYYDNWENYGGIPNIPAYSLNRDADTEEEAVGNSFSKTMQQLLSPVVDAVRQLWGKLSGKSLESVGEEDTKREAARNEPLKKKAMEDRQSVDPKKRNIDNAIDYLMELAKKALDFAYKVIDKIDVSKLTEETKKLKQAVLDILKKAKKELEKLLHQIQHGDDDSSSPRRARSVGKRANVRDALESYLTSLKSLKRSKARSSLRRSMTGNTSARASDMGVLMDLMTNIEECIQNIPPANVSLLGAECIVLPLIKVLASSKLGGANDSTMDADSDVRSDAIELPDNLRRLTFPWGSIFLIPIYNGQRPGDNSTVPPFAEQRSENVTTTTTTTTTTTEPTTTTEAHFIYDDLDTAARSDSKYRSKYDNRF